MIVNTLPRPVILLLVNNTDAAYFSTINEDIALDFYELYDNLWNYKVHVLSENELRLLLEHISIPEYKLKRNIPRLICASINFNVSCYDSIKTTFEEYNVLP